jgi:hypothetical protein
MIKGAGDIHNLLERAGGRDQAALRAPFFLAAITIGSGECS